MKVGTCLLRNLVYFLSRDVQKLKVIKFKSIEHYQIISRYFNLGTVKLDFNLWTPKCLKIFILTRWQQSLNDSQ